MLRRVKKDVISELTSKTEITVHCKLSSRQQAFYQAIKNKISLAELFDSNRGQLNEKKILNLMNIVIQLRKVDNPYYSAFIFSVFSFTSLNFVLIGPS
jgi:DNA helicase INO80